MDSHGSFDHEVLALDPISGFADLLNTIGRHAAAMDQADELTHEACLYCMTAVMLSRVVRFGDQLRETQ